MIFTGKVEAYVTGGYDAATIMAAGVPGQTFVVSEPTAINVPAVGQPTGQSFSR
ncbi:MAG: hypothetical protein KGJ21_02190 [Pseudomonadota bacterium]|nr:hypothetical protein [Pseudomonadota bacterium]